LHNFATTYQIALVLNAWIHWDGARPALLILSTEELAYLDELFSFTSPLKGLDNLSIAARRCTNIHHVILPLGMHGVLLFLFAM